MFLPKDIEFFTYLQNDELKEEFGYFIENDFKRKINFIYKIYPNKSSTKCVVKIDEKYYTYFTYFDDLQYFDDLYKAKDYLLLSDLKREMVIADD